MSRFFPTTPYPEDQPLAHTILTTHCLARGATTGAILSLTLHPIRNLLHRSQPARFSPARPLLRTAGTATAAGTAVLALGVVLRMRGCADIEWKDRSWRLQRNAGQVRCDDWSYGGAVAGLGVVGLRGGLKGGGWRASVGAAGVGSVVGMVGYLVWTYGFGVGRENLKF